MATDLVHVEALIDAALAELTAHLPANWFAEVVADPPPVYDDENPDPHYSWETPLALLEHGDLSDYAADPDGITLDCPAIIIRPLTITDAPEVDGIGGVEGAAHLFRLVHVRAWEQCNNATGGAQTNMTRARGRYAKIIGAALFADTYGRLDNPTLTSADSHANVAFAKFGRWDFAGATDDVQRIREQGQHLWAIALDFAVVTICGP